ncbi:hypothetical protein F5I97DRAFT_1810045 [Phlebopus sp. FC_14]|nr:hypothetical protein F5I97DRAFT_1810045 [Phlebopus sp. FC_14]
MPIREIEFLSEVESLRNGKEKYLVFFSSRVEGKLWCPDCVAVEELIYKTFGPEQGPSAAVVYVGQRSEWKSPDNIFRREPWPRLTAIPTIIRLSDDIRLVERDVTEKLLADIL